MTRGCAAGCVALAALGALLAAAAASAADEAKPRADAVVAELPFLEASERTAVFVDLAPEGSARPLPLLLDTGASGSVLTPRLARELGITPRRLRSAPYRRPTRLGRDLLFHVDTSAGDTGSAAGWEYGLLGGDFLSHYVVEIDYPARRVRFLDPERFTVPEQVPSGLECALPLRLVANRPLLLVTVGEREVLVLLDTGSPFGLVLGAEEAARAGVTASAIPGFAARSVRGEVALELGELARLALGGCELRDLPVVVAPRGLYQQATATDSVLGHDLLALHTVRLDYPRRRLWLRRRDAAVPQLLGDDWSRVEASGALLAPHDGALAVQLVLPASPAQRLGLSVGDRFPLAAGTDAEDARAKIHASLARGEPQRVERADADGTWQALELRTGATRAPPE